MNEIISKTSLQYVLLYVLMCKDFLNKLRTNNENRT